ncbi:phosphatase PAP2 family protein [Anaerococcus martiniensis]|uniref:phosphatase PAP2 family protein n=1 Tax=Anaerococcus sp. WGS1579 TaxID=3366809 RepID=UPI00372D22BB
MGPWTSFEIGILDAIQKLSTPGLDKFMVTITSLGNMSIIWIAFIIIFLSTKEYKTMGKVMVLGFILNLIIVNLLLKNIFTRVRPFNIVNYANLLIPALKDGSFPSGHTSYAFTIFTIVLFMAKKKSLKVLTGILAVLIAFSRLYLYVHFPTDVIGGAIIGFILAILAMKIYFTKNIREKLANTNLQRSQKVL